MIDLIVRARWGLGHPAQDEVRREVDVMTRVCTDALCAFIPPGDLQAIELKGSSIKEWESRIDYVPEFSDVDIHILFVDDEAADRNLQRVEHALQIQTRIGESYRTAVSDPIHVPRLQFTVANELLLQTDYVPSPPATVRVLYGQPPPAALGDAVVDRAQLHRKLTQSSPYLARLGFQAVDRQSTYLWPLVRAMTWRIAPTGPNVLELLGFPHADAWSINRSTIVQRLADLGERELASQYVDFYLSMWDGFMSHCLDDAAARSALLAGARVLELGEMIAHRDQPGPE